MSELFKENHRTIQLLTKDNKEQQEREHKKEQNSTAIETLIFYTKIVDAEKVCKKEI
jgi:hypothetical protein